MGEKRIAMCRGNTKKRKEVLMRDPKSFFHVWTNRAGQKVRVEMQCCVYCNFHPGETCPVCANTGSYPTDPCWDEPGRCPVVEPIGWEIPGQNRVYENGKRVGLFPTFQAAQDWRSAQIWNGGIGDTPEPVPVYSDEE